MDKKFLTSYSGASFNIKDGVLIKHGRNLYASGIMQLKYEGNIFRTPRVYGIGEDHIAMDYMQNAVSLPEYLKNCTIGQADDIMRDLIKYVKTNKERKKIFISPDVVREKITHVATRLHDYEDIFLARNISLAFGESPIEIETGDYHGDLTFNNILVDENRELYLIDFLPGYAPTYWLDVVKLQQECALEWSSYFVEVNETYMYALDAIKPFLEPYFNGPHKRTLMLMEAINYLRILPYAKDNRVMADNLRTSIKNILS